MITITRRIDPSDELVHFIRHNSNKRRHMWNKFVEKYNEGYKDFNPNKVREELIKEDAYLMKHTDDENIKSMFCADIPLSVYKDVKQALKVMRTMHKRYGKVSKLRFKKHDTFKKAFRVRTRNEISNTSMKPKGKVRFDNINEFVFRASYDHRKNRFRINLIEPIADEYDDESYEFTSYFKNSQRKRYSFHHEDIKEIIFKEELGKYYIMLQCKVTYYIYKDDVKCRHEVAGIDLGIHNPATLYSGNRPIFMAMSNDAITKIHQYERYIERLQHAMDIKMAINKDRNALDENYPIYTKRYRKIHRRFRKYHKRIRDIRKNWRYSQTHLITTKFRNLVVDSFNTPDNTDADLPNEVKRRYNHFNREHAMSYFKKALEHMTIKNGCAYIESPQCTTRTCAICGHVNPKLPLSERNLTCESCGITIDRDVNAAMNCYDFYVKLAKKK